MSVPSNNDFVNATVITGSTGYVINQTNISATFEPSWEPPASAGATVWYKFSPPSSDYYEFYTLNNPSILGHTYPTQALMTYLQMFSGTSTSSLTELTYISPYSYTSRYANSNLGSLIAVGSLTSGSQYYIRVDGYGSASAYNQNYGYGNSGSQGNFDLSWTTSSFLSHFRSCAQCADNNRGVGYSCLLATASIPDVTIWNTGPDISSGGCANPTTSWFNPANNPPSGSFLTGGIWYPMGNYNYGTYAISYCGGAYNCYDFEPLPMPSWLINEGGGFCNNYDPNTYFWYISASVSKSFVLGDLNYYAGTQADVNFHYQCAKANFLHTSGAISMQWLVPNPNCFDCFNFLCYQNGNPNPSYGLYEILPDITAYNVPGACAQWTDSGSAGQAYFNIFNNNDLAWQNCTLQLDTSYGGISATSTITGAFLSASAVNTINPIYFTSSVGANCTARLLITSPMFPVGVSQSIDFYLGPTFNVAGPTVITCRGGSNGAHFVLTYTGAWKVDTMKCIFQSSTGINLNDVFPDNTCTLSSLTTGSVYDPFSIGGCQCIENGTFVPGDDFYTIRFFGTNRQISASFFCGATHAGSSVVGGLNNI